MVMPGLDKIKLDQCFPFAIISSKRDLNAIAMGMPTPSLFKILSQLKVHLTKMLIAPPMDIPTQPPWAPPLNSSTGVRSLV
jgi:hypothetical protein